MEKTPETMLTQLILRGLIFLVFFLSIFIAMPSSIIYLLILFIVANVVVGFINEHRGIVTNVVLLALSLLLLVFLIEYLATIIGAVISFFHLLFFGIAYFKKEKKPVKSK